MENAGYKIIVDVAEFNVITRSKTAASGISVPEVHGVDKPLDPDKKPEHDKTLQKEIKIDHASRSMPQIMGSPVPTMIPNMPMARPPLRLPVKVAPPTSPSPYRPNIPTPRGIPSPVHIRSSYKTPVKMNNTQQNVISRTPQAPRIQGVQIKPRYGTPTHGIKVLTPRKSLFDPQQGSSEDHQNHIKKEPEDFTEYLFDNKQSPINMLSLSQVAYSLLNSYIQLSQNLVNILFKPQIFKI